MGPIKTELVTFKKSDLFHNRLLIAIDSGCSLTKILFLNKRDQAQFLNKEEKSIILEFSIFQNVNFEEALERIKLHAYLKEDDLCKIHITGTFACNNKEKIKSILNKDVVYIDGLMSKKVGLRVALEHIGIENMIVENADVHEDVVIESNMIEKVIESMKTKMQSDKNLSNESGIFPCLFQVHGSISRFIYFDENKNSKVIGLIGEGGKSFLGLAKCILDTNDYNEIVKLASHGNLGNVDTLAHEMIDGNIDSPYGRFPPDMPLFSFGKCFDLNKGRQDLNKEDLALSLISLYAFQIILDSFGLCFMWKTSKVYLIGNVFMADIFQKELKKRQAKFPKLVDFIFLNCGYAGSLGAMVMDETENYEKNND